MIINYLFLIISLSWTAPQGGQEVDGYRIYYNGDMVDVGDTLNYQLPVSAGVRYVIYATAYNQYGESDPSNIVCYPSLKLSIQGLPQGFLLTWQGFVGENYTIYYTDELGSGWVVLANNIIGSDRIMAYIDATTDTAQKRFYRIGLQ